MVFDLYVRFKGRCLVFGRMGVPRSREPPTDSRCLRLADASTGPGESCVQVLGYVTVLTSHSRL